MAVVGGDEDEEDVSIESGSWLAFSMSAVGRSSEVGMIMVCLYEV